MFIYILMGSLLLCYVLYKTWKNIGSQRQKQDSMLKKKAILNAYQQMTFTRLKQMLPQRIILARVSFDLLLTTKYSWTRNKYRNMVADFVILDNDHQVLAIVALDDPMALKRPQNAQYQDALLEMAGYSVIRYEQVPEYSQLKRDFNKQITLMQMIDAELDEGLKSEPIYSKLKYGKVNILT